MAQSFRGRATTCWLLLFAAPFGIAWAAAPPPRPLSPEALAGLIRQLGADEFVAREAASRQLLLVGRSALPTLRREVADADPEVRQRCKDLVGRIDANRIALRAKGAILNTSDEKNPDGDVLWAHLNGAHFGDEDLDALAGMRALKHVDLTGSSVTDAGLRKLVRLPALEDVILCKTGITGSGLAHLKEIPSLDTLFLDHTPIKEEHLAHLRQLRNLATLTLRNTPVTDKGLALLRGNDLYLIALCHTRITDDGLAHLAGMKNLRYLCLHGMPITERGFNHFRGHKELRLIQVTKEVKNSDLESVIRTLPKYIPDKVQKFTPISPASHVP